MVERVPTVDDLRVKLCYICREEETYGEGVADNADASSSSPTTTPPSPSSPLKSWTHPCTCTLIAHEACLLKWIATPPPSNSSSAAASSRALKCPQCGTPYILTSRNPLILRWLGQVNKALQRVGRLVTLGGAMLVVGAIGGSVYVLCTAYGAWALRKFLGDEMYELLLTSSYHSWPISAYLNLPLIPLSLILSRFTPTSKTLPLLPLLLVWPPSSPAGDTTNVLKAHWARPSSTSTSFSWSSSTSTSSLSPPSRLATSTPAYARPGGPALTTVLLTSWPPAPFLFGCFVVPVVRVVYRKWFNKLEKWVLGKEAVEAVASARRRRRERVGTGTGGGGAGGDGAAAAAGGGEAGQQQQQQQQQQNNGGGGFAWNVGDGALVIRVRAGGDEQPPQQQQQQQGAANANGEGPIAPPQVNGDQAAAAAAEAEEEEELARNPAIAALAAAEQQIVSNTSSIGRIIGGALLIPAIANLMGKVLLRLSLRSVVMQRFLAIPARVVEAKMREIGYGFGGGVQGGGVGVGAGVGKSGLMGWTANLASRLGLDVITGGGGGGASNISTNTSNSTSSKWVPPPPLGAYSFQENWKDLSLGRQVALAFKLAVGAFGVGTKTWTESDPVWWRNSVGMGVFVLLKDLIQLLHLYLVKREIESRRVKSRDFAGVDVTELDLLPGFFQAAR